MATSNKGIDSGSGNRNELEKMLANYSSLIAELFSAMSDGVMGPAQIAGDSSPEKIIERLIEQDLALKKEVYYMSLVKTIGYCFLGRRSGKSTCYTTGNQYPTTNNCW
eukprot:m.60213 g.60213  ORF g.60213 m.60213 type:complete len:108 (+) comp11304_c0_seq2:357-680(+)